MRRSEDCWFLWRVEDCCLERVEGWALRVVVVVVAVVVLMVVGAVLRDGRREIGRDGGRRVLEEGWRGMVVSRLNMVMSTLVGRLIIVWRLL